MSCRQILFSVTLSCLTVWVCGNGAYGANHLQDNRTTDDRSEIGFVTYLMARGDFKEALFLLEAMKGILSKIQLS